MQKDDIIEIEEKEYYVVDTFSINENEYALLNPLKEIPNAEETMIVRTKENQVFAIEEEEKSRVLKHLETILEDGE